MRSDITFIKDTAIEFASRIPWLGLALAIVTAVFFAAPWLSN